MDQEESPFYTPSNRIFTVKPTLPKVIGWVGLVLFLFGSVACYRAAQGGVTPLFLLMAALSVWIILTKGELSMSQEEIVYTTFLAKFQMQWSEIKEAEQDFKGRSLVFYAADRNKRMAVIGVQYWLGPDANGMSKLMKQQMKARQIPLWEKERAAFVISKNTRVK